MGYDKSYKRKPIPSDYSQFDGGCVYAKGKMYNLHNCIYYVEDQMIISGNFHNIFMKFLLDNLENVRI